MGSGSLDVLTKMAILLTYLNRPLLPAWNHVPALLPLVTSFDDLSNHSQKQFSQTDRTET